MSSTQAAAALATVSDMQAMATREGGNLSILAFPRLIRHVWRAIRTGNSEGMTKVSGGVRGKAEEEEGKKSSNLAESGGGKIGSN